MYVGVEYQFFLKLQPNFRSTCAFDVTPNLIFVFSLIVVAHAALNSKTPCERLRELPFRPALGHVDARDFPSLCYNSAFGSE